MNLLVVGSGGREHAISKKLLESNNVENVYCAPGNDGMRLDNIQLVAISETDKAGLIDFAKKAEIAFVIVGPEVPLLEGVVDALEEAGIKAFGPKANAALIEGSRFCETIYGEICYSNRSIKNLHRLCGSESILG